MTAISTPSTACKLVNGIELSPTAAASKLRLDTADPLAVLALKLVADGTGVVRQRASTRAELLARLQAQASSDANVAGLQRPDAVPAALSAVAVRLEAAKAAQKEALAAIQSISRELDDTSAKLDRLRASRSSYSAVLWWFGIGWLLWTLTGNQKELDRLASEVQARKSKVEHAEGQKEIAAAQMEQCTLQEKVLRQIEAIDAQPITLLRRFGWSHVPLRVAPGTGAEDRLIFTSLWARNFTHEFPDIEDGLARVDALRDRVLGGGKLPVLLSPTTDDSADLRGLVGEELLLAQNIDTFAKLSESARRTTVEATMLPADPAIDSHFRAWTTEQVLPPAAPACLAQPDASRVEGLVALLRQAHLEELDPELNLAKRLAGVAESLRDRTEDFGRKRAESIEGLMGRILSEWSSWTMLPLRRRYCPSFHKSPAYRHARLGFALDQVFDERGAFVQTDKIHRLPDPRVIERKIGEYTAAWQRAGQRAEGLESKREELLQLIAKQVEGTKIVGLSAGARLHYNLARRQWQCGLCVHEPRIGGEGSPECHLGCPAHGLFTDEEAVMAEQYVQYEDLLIPMLTNLWNEKSTHDEVNRVVREKEAELRRNVLEEQQSLRDEARIFKEAARDRIVRLEDMRGQAKELIEKFREEVQAAQALGALDGPRQLELENQVRSHERQVATIGEISLNARNLEDGLAADVDATLASRDIVLEERIRRSSDAPAFVHLPPPVMRRALLPATAGALPGTMSSGGGSDVVWVRVRGEASFARRTVDDLTQWLADADHLATAEQLEVSDSQRAWRPLLEHPRLSAARPSEGAADGPPRSPQPAMRTPPPVPDAE